MNTRICLVTGANSGIGQALANELVKQNTTVVMVCRDRSRGAATRAAIQAQSGQAVDLMIADLASQTSIRQLAGEVRARYPRLDVLVNNAAVVKNVRTTTADGLETMFATNHLAPFLLTNLLLDSLKQSNDARILNITAPSTVKPAFDDLQGERRFSSLNNFGATKMENLLFTFELARRLEGTGITANAIHPGLARSNLMREANPLMRFVANLASAPPERVVADIVRVAIAPEFAGKTGHFYYKGKDFQVPSYAHDRDAQARLWELSAQLAHLDLGII